MFVMHPMWPAVRVGLVVAAPALLVAACAGSSSTSSGGYAGGSGATGAGSTSVTVETHQGDLGTYLTDSSGRSLYLFEADQGGRPTCSGPCAAAWPPLTSRSAPKVSGAAEAGKLGTVSRGSGAPQVTYGGHPLYYFAGDSSAGQTNGQGSNGFGALWWVVAPDGTAITGAGGGTAPSGSGGYSY
jgi:predicted lipoprotein with Yx(FWY)xxD motif